MTERSENPFRTLAGAAGPAKPAADLVMPQAPQAPLSEEERFREELEKGIVFTTVESVVNWARANAIWPLGIVLACCDIVMMSIARPRLDVSRLGTVALRGSPIQAILMHMDS